MNVGSWVLGLIIILIMQIAASANFPQHLGLILMLAIIAQLLNLILARMME